MAVSKIGLNLSAFNNVEPPTLDVANTTKGLFNQIPEKANEITQGWFGYGVMATMFIGLMWILGDKSPFGDFQYDNLRAMGLSFGICSIFGMLLLNMNFINNLIVVTTCIIMMMLAMLIIIFTEETG